MKLRQLAKLLVCIGMVGAVGCTYSPGLPSSEAPSPQVQHAFQGRIVVRVGETAREGCVPQGGDWSEPYLDYSWASNDPSIATIAGASPADGCSAHITGVAIGTTTVQFEIGVTEDEDIGHRFGTLIVEVVAADSPACIASTTISDPFESPPVWNTTLISTTGATAAIEPRVTGGDPAGFRFMQHNLPGNSDVTVIHFLGGTGKTYNPATQGAIHRINYSEDRIVLNPPFAGAAIGSSFVILQSGTMYIKTIGANGAFTNTNWATATLLSLTAADFPGIDFTISGGEMTFGFVRSNTNNGSTAATLQHGIDNFAVTICH